MILRQKKGMVKKSGLVELIDTPESLDSIGGLDDLKNYLKEKANIFHNLSEALKYGVSMPKGVFLVGMPGCGKSLCAKAAASIFEVPLLKLDMGSMMGKYVGQSEENLRKAIKIAEAAAPCILWIDEIEKAFSGVGGQNDAVLTRMFGNFLFWMQEKKSSVYVVATANNAESLPPELKRKGRFDEIFCVNLPTKEERKKIFDVHLNKLKGKACIDSNSSFDYEKLSEATSGFNGADIESVVHQTIEKCFLNNRSGVTTSDLMATAKKTLSITKSCKKQIDAMQSVFKESSFRDATTGKITSA
jgi:SpoVK/Ycf46/Vps4 family AAA+-type ATPase